ncbi:hypothetical protein Q8F55_007323 [Vanrija albida]|uniref:Uncharacterized protein n=1 Tax=Vanrija albida TaxID=181172 RepID=A0ABR3Q0B7_9TREE
MYNHYTSKHHVCVTVETKQKPEWRDGMESILHEHVNRMDGRLPPRRPRSGAALDYGGGGWGTPGPLRTSVKGWDVAEYCNDWPTTGWDNGYADGDNDGTYSHSEGPDSNNDGTNDDNDGTNEYSDVMDSGDGINDDVHWIAFPEWNGDDDDDDNDTVRGSD